MRKAITRAHKHTHTHTHTTHTKKKWLHIAKPLPPLTQTNKQTNKQLGEKTNKQTNKHARNSVLPTTRWQPARQCLLEEAHCKYAHPERVYATPAISNMQAHTHCIARAGSQPIPIPTANTASNRALLTTHSAPPPVGTPPCHTFLPVTPQTSLPAHPPPNLAEKISLPFQHHTT